MELNDKAYIYKITHKLSNQFYIGSTTNIKTRLDLHLSESRRFLNSPLHRLMNKRNCEKSEFEIILLEKCDFTVSKVIESEYIRKNIDNELCLNKRIENRTDEEKKNMRRQYYVKNKERLKEYSRRRYYISKFVNFFGHECGFRIEVSI